LDVEFAAAIAARYERRTFAIKRLLERLGSRLSQPIAGRPEDKLQALLALTGFEFYDVLAGEGQSPQEVAEVVFRLVVAEIGI
jgi:hypothetical protein